MEEQKLDFRNNDDPTLIEFDQDKKRNAMELIQDLHFAAEELYNRLKSNSLEKGFSETLLSLIGSYVVNVHEIFNYESVLKKEEEGRHAKIRELNIQNHELRRQLGEKCSPEDVREKLKNFEESIREWWKKEGLGHVSEITFYPYVCRIKLSGTMSILYDKCHPEYLRSKGYDVVEPERGHFELKHSDKNVELLICEVKKRFQSSQLTDIDVAAYHGLHIRYAEFIIKNYDDIDSATVAQTVAQNKEGESDSSEICRF